MTFDADIGSLIEPISGRRADPAELRLRVAERAEDLEAAGIGRGSAVFVHFGNCIDFYVEILALWRIGASAAPIDPRLTAHEVRQCALVARPQAAVWLAAPPDDVASVLSELGASILVLESRSGSRARAAARPDAELDQSLPAILLFTSGTTGQPKAVVHTHGALRARWRRKREALGTAAFERTMCVVPTQYSFGLGVTLFPWLNGGTLLLLPPFRQDVLVKLGELCDEHSATCVAAVPAVWRIVTRLARPPSAGRLRIATSGTSPLPTALRQAVARWAQAPAADIYGMTETGWIAASIDGDGGSSEADALSGTCVGRPLGLEVAILPQPPDTPVLDFGARCQAGERGHVYVRTDSLMQGYLDRPVESAAVLRGGWFCTGDLGSLDAQGRLHLHGRHKEMINVGGSKLYPQDLDALLLSHPAVQDACTFAVDDPLLGESAAVALVIAPQDEALVASVLSFVVERLAEHQIPRRWHLVEAVGRTARGKLDRAATARACAGRRPLDFKALRAASH